MVLSTPPPPPPRAGGMLAVRDLLDKERIDLISYIPNFESHWDWLVAADLCEIYGLEDEGEVLDRWLNTLPSVRGRRSGEYVEAVRQGQKEVRERVNTSRRERSSGGPPPEG